MALVFCDGFEQYSTTVHFSNATNQGQYIAVSSPNGYGWIGSSGATIIADSTTTRTAQTGTAKSLKVGASNLLCKIPNPSSLIIGFGFRTSSLAANIEIATFSNSSRSSTDLGLRVRVLSTGALNFYNELTNTSIATSAAGLIAINTWYHIEVKILFGLAGSVEGRINEANDFSAAVVDTLCGATTATCFHLMSSVAGPVYFDDLYVCDETGSVNNTYLGAVGIYTLFPDANGTTNDFTVTGAASNAAAVNSIAPDYTSYVTGEGSGLKELYDVQNLPITPTTISGVMVAGRLQDVSSSQTSTRELGIATSGTELFGTAQMATAGSWTNIRQVFEKQADGVTGWNTAAVNGMQIGIKNT